MSTLSIIAYLVGFRVAFLVENKCRSFNATRPEIVNSQFLTHVAYCVIDEASANLAFLLPVKRRGRLAKAHKDAYSPSLCFSTKCTSQCTRQLPPRKWLVRVDEKQNEERGTEIFVWLVHAFPSLNRKDKRYLCGIACASFQPQHKHITNISLRV